jgi:hypothetical protein
MRTGKAVRIGLAVLFLAASPAGRGFAQTDIDTVPAFDAAARENDFAVVIGIEKYRDLPSSDYSAADADLVAKYLLALGFPARNIQLLLNERASRADIVKAVDRWLPNSVKPESRVFVYYSGHGSPEPATGESYLVPYDGDANYLEETAYPLKRLYDVVGKLPVKESAIVMDSCFSGAGGRSVLAQGARPLVATMMKPLAPPPNMAILAATKGSQISTSSPDKRHGVFTYHFLRAIRDGKTALAEVYEHVKPRVEDDARRLNVEQTPNLTPAPEQVQGRFVFFSHTPLPASARQDPEINARLEAERQKFEAEQLRLAEERRQLMEAMEREKRNIELERVRMEQDLRAKERSMEEERRRLQKQKKKDDGLFVPPTF